MKEMYLHYVTSTQPIKRVICFHHAGGTATFYGKWREYIRDDIEILSFMLPGHDRRMREDFCDNLKEVVQDIVNCGLEMFDLPFILYGHSMGGLMAYELAKLLEMNYHICPDKLIISGCNPPHYYDFEKKISTLSNKNLIQFIEKYGGISYELLNNNKFIEFLLPMIKADFIMCEKYRCENITLLKCPICIMGGTEDDHVKQKDLIEWKNYTFSQFELIKFVGGHFFNMECIKEICEIINRQC